MLAPKDLLDALSGHASRLFSGETPLPRNEIESQFKACCKAGSASWTWSAVKSSTARW
jgi:ubiquinone biosynthesis accessory factor UbiK